jgi:hypothetical protein
MYIYIIHTRCFEGERKVKREKGEGERERERKERGGQGEEGKLREVPGKGGGYMCVEN